MSYHSFSNPKHNKGLKMEKIVRLSNELVIAERRLFRLAGMIDVERRSKWTTSFKYIDALSGLTQSEEYIIYESKYIEDYIRLVQEFNKKVKDLNKNTVDYLLNEIKKELNKE
jgi:hypothetical protein